MIFGKFRHSVTLRTKPLLSPINVTCFKISTFSLEKKLIRVLSTFLAHTSKIMIIRILLQDILTEPEQQQVIQYHHKEKTCHRGIKETVTSIQKMYFWPNIQNDVRNFINTCQTCLLAKYDRNPQKIKLQITETLSRPFDTFTLIHSL